MLKLFVLMFSLLPIQSFAAEPSAECAANQAAIANIVKMMNEFGTRYMNAKVPRQKRCGMGCESYREFCKNPRLGKMAMGDGMILRGQFQSTAFPESCAPYVREADEEVKIKLGYLQNGFRNCESCDFSKPSKDEPAC